MEEEWLLALQDELTKPYFLNVRFKHSINIPVLTCQLKKFVMAEQKAKKVFPPGRSTSCPI